MIINKNWLILFFLFKLKLMINKNLRLLKYNE